MTLHSNLAGFAARLRDMISAACQSPIGEAEFNDLALDLFALQYRANEPYRRWCNARDCVPGRLEDWTVIPAVPTAAFKELELSCLIPAQRTAVFHSSGTTAQQPSRHFHSRESLAVYEASLVSWFGRHFPLARLPRNGDGADQAPTPVASSGRAGLDPSPEWLFLTPPPAQAPHSSLVHMFETIWQEAGGSRAAFLGTIAQDGQWELPVDQTMKVLDGCSRQRKPVMVLGTAFSFVQLLDGLAARRTRLQLSAGSGVMETGGYKGRVRALPRGQLYEMLARGLGIPQDRIVSEYGMSELSSQAYDHSLVSAGSGGPQGGRCFRFPPWARARIVSPETGREVAEGEAGLIQLFDLANVYSVMAVQTEDVGVRRGGGFELKGRAALAEARGCSLMAR